jgi:ABC-type branched-subunit amino acid transport system ATPase component
VPELLRVDNLSAGYGEAVVLQGVSLALDEGETLALLGRNGTVLTEGTPDQIAADPEVKAVYLGHGEEREAAHV